MKTGSPTIHETDDMYDSETLRVCKYRKRESSHLDALLPSLPFAWNRPPGFNVNDMPSFAECIIEESRPFPQPAYAWSDAIGFYVARAISNCEALPLVDFVKENGRLACKARFTAVSLAHAVWARSCFPLMDLANLYSTGEIVGVDGSKTGLFSVPDEYLKYLSPVLREHAWDDVIRSPLVDTEGVCYLVLANGEHSKHRKHEFDGLQAFVNAVWKEGRTDIFDLSVSCYVDYLCFRVIAAPLQLWLPDEPPLKPFLSSALVNSPEEMSVWEAKNRELSQILQSISSHIPGCGKYPFGQGAAAEYAPDEARDDTTSLLIAVNRQKLVPYCPMHLVSTASDPGRIDKVVKLLTDFDCLVTSPIVLRSVLRENGVRVRHLGEVMRKLALPVLKQIIVSEMLARARKWLVRHSLLAAFEAGKPVGSVDVPSLLSAGEVGIEQNACEYFQVALEEIRSYNSMTSNSDAYRVGYLEAADFSLPQFRVFFPHFEFLQNPIPNFFPSVVRFVAPRPRPVDPTTLQLRYACEVFRLEMAIASADIFEAVVVISSLCQVVLKMREIDPNQQNQEALRVRAFALCSAARAMLPPCVAMPALINHTVLECSPSLSVYQQLRAEIAATEGLSSISTLCLDNQMAKCLFEKFPAEALPILNLAALRAEKDLGARHPVTVAIWIRKAQTVKKVLESIELPREPADREEYIQQGIKCLNKAMLAAEMSERSTGLLDAASFSHHLLSVLHLWNGEPGKAAGISRSGLLRLEAHFGRNHPRYLNTAFLHAKLLECYAASCQSSALAADTAREAVEVLEGILDTLIELVDENGVVPNFKDFIDDSDMMSAETEMKRKLAISALILKLNVWLLDPAEASDLMDFVVADKLKGSRGVALLPRRAAVKEAVKTLLKSTMSPERSKFMPVLELSSSLPDSVLHCCNSALLAKSKGMRVSDWFRNFHQSTVRTIGDDFTLNSTNQRARELLISLFLTFVFINDNGLLYIGPITCPLLPKPEQVDKHKYHSRGVIYREWERSATLYSIDHELYPINNR